jgi:hypothetical protein
MSARNCSHHQLTCLNEHELVRKYRCDACRAVMMCACDEGFGRRFLAHQLDEGVELDTQERIAVTAGFQEHVCNECRGLPLIPAPAAATPGRTTKIKRFYWRELFFGETERVADWEEANPDASAEDLAFARKRIRNEVVAELKALHASAPKYDTREPSQSEILARCAVGIDDFKADYVEASKKGALILSEGAVVSAESFAAGRYEAQGWSVLPLESVPFHALFGVMMWLLIGDPRDPKNRMAGFGSRTAFEGGVEAPPIFTMLPEDFGTPGYGRRRAARIDDHFALMVPDGIAETGCLLDLFDYLRSPSENLRQYLWAHRDADVDRARRLIEILPAATIIEILRYLVEDYWGRYVGWPDLLLWRADAFMMIEVKSSSDRLSVDQMRWISDNHEILKLPFRLAKLHRRVTG